MSLGKIVALGALGVFLLFGLGYCGSALGYRSDCVSAEAGIKAQHTQNQNNYDNMWKRFQEMAQVPAMYRDDMKQLWDSAIQGRYGPQGSQAVFQFIREHNPTLDASMYTRIQQAIESGRTGFAADQQMLIDKKREYEVIIQGNRALFVGFLFGFPKIDLDRYGIVTSDETAEAFRSGKAGTVKLRP